MGWRWSAGRALRSKWRAFIVVLVPTKDARLHTPLTAVIASKLMTAACRVSGVTSGALLRQMSSIGAAWTLRDAAVHRPLQAAAASRVLGCTVRACFAASAHCLGAAAVVGGRLGVGVGLRDAHVDQRERPDASPGQFHHRPRTCDGLCGRRTS